MSKTVSALPQTCHEGHELLANELGIDESTQSLGNFCLELIAYYKVPETDIEAIAKFVLLIDAEIQILHSGLKVSERIDKIRSICQSMEESDLRQCFSSTILDFEQLDKKARGIEKVVLTNLHQLINGEEKNSQKNASLGCQSNIN